MSPTELRLRDCLTGGPRNSREVIAEMIAVGHTAKQVRLAREKLGIVARRSGQGKSMKSTWAMPSASAQADRDHGAIRAHGRSSDDPAQPVATAVDADLDELELRRLNGRVEAFIRRGLGADEARVVAVALVARDRGNVHAMGSCIECQALERQECPVTPRPATDVHQCWLRRVF